MKYKLNNHINFAIYFLSKHNFLQKIIFITGIYSLFIVIGFQNIAKAENIKSISSVKKLDKATPSLPLQLNYGTAEDLKYLEDEQLSTFNTLSETKKTFNSIADFENLAIQSRTSWQISNSEINSDTPQLNSNSATVKISQSSESTAENTAEASESLPDYAPNKTPETSSPPAPANATPPPSSGLTLDKIQTDFSYQSDNYELDIYSVEPSIQFRLGKNHRINLKSGFKTLTGQPGFESVTIYPVRLGWEGYFPRFSLKAGATLNNFDRLPSAIGADAGLSVPVLPNMVIGATVERTPMKYAPSVLENPEQTTYTSYGPNLYWQIDSKTTLTSFFNFLQYNDGNRSQLSYTKLKRNIDNFSVAFNLVTSSFERNASFTSGYFSPPDFLLYNGEIGWQGDISKNLNFRVQFNLGQQRTEGEYSSAFYTEAQLTAKFNQNFDAFLKYSYGKLDQITYYRNLGATQDDLYEQSLLTGQLQYRF